MISMKQKKIKKILNNKVPTENDSENKQKQ